MDFDTLTAGLPGGHRVGPSVSPEITGVAKHSGQVTSGDLWIALVGDRFDAHRFIPEVVERNAAGLLLDRRGVLPEGVEIETLARPAVLVDDTRAAMGVVAERFYQRPFDALTAVAVTGTNGKTTTTLVLEAILGSAGLPCGVVGTLFFRFGMWEIHGQNTTPDALDLQRLAFEFKARGARAIALEASSHGLETHRLDGTRVDVAIFTNLSHDHLDFHGTFDAYFEAKKRLFSEILPASRQAGKLGVAVINGDDPYGRRLIKECAANAVSYGLTDESDVHTLNPEFSLEGTTFDLEQQGHPSARFQTSLVGRHNLYNVLGAITAARSLGISDDAIRSGLAALDCVPGRLESIESQDATAPSVFVDYAHTPDALRAVLTTLRQLSRRSAGKLIVVFGCGGDRDAAKRPEMGKVVAQLADVAVVTSDNPRSEDPQAIVEQILGGMGGSNAQVV
ncbi:MAG: UDP-N-acetylmuramoyl-L-alanyl-D-glutamate--2,6-diaminopimelate ligase, partial [Myxococcales bacterium]|nr:UDP-N-acetylmuramoyl-L-alanyl-D-glutamate--2,6-diaminopimelate ligase [Myxococcales bacterium]